MKQVGLDGCLVKQISGDGEWVNDTSIVLVSLLTLWKLAPLPMEYSIDCVLSNVFAREVGGEKDGDNEFFITITFV